MRIRLRPQPHSTRWTRGIFPFFLILGLALSCTGNAPQAVKPPMTGWSSWNAYTVNISDSIIRHQANLLVERGLKDAGYSNVNIDDEFFGYRDERGYMIPHPVRFRSTRNCTPETTAYASPASPHPRQRSTASGLSKGD